jgi:hypothetical protein
MANKFREELAKLEWLKNIDHEYNFVGGWQCLSQCRIFIAQDAQIYPLDVEPQFRYDADPN